MCPPSSGRYWQRIDALHLRDIRGKEQVPLGKGEVDFAAIAAENPRQRLERVFDGGGREPAQHDRCGGDRVAATGRPRHDPQDFRGVEKVVPAAADGDRNLPQATPPHRLRAEAHLVQSTDAPFLPGRERLRATQSNLEKVLQLGKLICGRVSA